MICSSPKNCHITGDAADLNRCDVSRIRGSRSSYSRGRSWNCCAMGLDQTNFDNAAHFVTVAIDPTFTTWVELKQLSKYILSGGSRTADRVLKVVWGRIGRSVRSNAV